MDNPESLNESSKGSTIEASTSSSSSGSFYDESGRIADPNIAQELATTEANLGVNAELRQEQALRTLSETGMTEQEGKNVEMMDKLLEKYPDAFKSMILEDGTKIILQKPSFDPVYMQAELGLFGSLTPSPSLIFSKDGLIVVQGYVAEDIYPHSLFEILAKVRKDPDAFKQRNFKPEMFTDSTHALRAYTYVQEGLGKISENPAKMKLFGQMFKVSQEKGLMERSKSGSEKSSDEILGML